MEEKKDNYADNNRKDAPLKNEANKEFYTSVPATQDGHFHFLSQKAQRLSTALYMLTNLFEHEDPLRFKLREMSIALVSDTMSLINLSVKERDTKIKSTYFLSSEILSFSEIAYASGMISEMNHTILKREFHIFMETLQSKRVRKDEENTFTIPSNFFEVNQIVEKKEVGMLEGGSFERDVLHTLALSHTASSNVHKGQYKRQTSNKDTVLYKGVPRETSSVDRKEMILRTFKESKKPALSIKDIGEFIKDCSEKTIQRQLIDMVKSGVLEKQGERRWSTYSLKK